MEHVPFAIIAIVWMLNLAISYWNARVVGSVWVETKQMGGFAHFMAWMGGIMSASGFTWCYLIALLFGAYYIQPAPTPDHSLLITPGLVADGLSLGYVVLVPGMLFSGFMIMVQSWVNAWREHSAVNLGVAAWNTFAQAHNTYSAMRGMPEALRMAGNLLGGRGDAKGKAALIVIGLVVLAIVAGVLTTIAIVRHYAAIQPLPERREDAHAASHRTA